jgi:hypothetical protein
VILANGNKNRVKRGGKTRGFHDFLFVLLLVKPYEKSPVILKTKDWILEHRNRKNFHI